MLQNWKRAGFAAALAVGAMTIGTTAEARDRYRDRGDETALVIGAGIIGLALGAAIASDNDRYYYRDGYYYGPPRHYYRGYPREYRYDRYPRRDYRAYRGHDHRRDRHRERRYRGW
ncbi:MAG: hypothetical protein WCY29_14800 [Novosphingobium sp.]